MPAYLDWPLDQVPSSEQEYDQYAEVYDLLFGTRGEDLDYYVNLASRTLAPGGEILELGTGTGRVAETLIERGFKVVGVDISENMLSKAREKANLPASHFSALKGDIRSFNLGRKFSLIIAPFGMMAHLLTREDRHAAFSAIRAHLSPGGLFVYDDAPSWLFPPNSGDHFETLKVVDDPISKKKLRVSTYSIDVEQQPYTLCYHFIDWLSGSLLSRRLVVRVMFRNTLLSDELVWLKESGFERVELRGGFDSRAFNHDDFLANKRLLVKCFG